MKPSVPKFIKSVQKSISKHSPEILTAAGIAGMATTVVLAVKSTPKALKQIEDAEKEKGEKLTKVEVVKATWKTYVPTALTGVASAACVIGANSVHTRRQAALYSAYKLSETAYTEYREKVKEEVGEKKEKEIQEKVSQDKVVNLVYHEDGIVHTGNGNTLFLEPLSKTVFRSSKNAIEKSINELNWKMTHGNEPHISFEEFLYELKLPKYDLGNEIGWRTDKGLIDISFPTAETDAGEPCFALTYLIPPEWDFDNLY